LVWERLSSSDQIIIDWEPIVIARPLTPPYIIIGYPSGYRATLLIYVKMRSYLCDGKK